MIMKKRFIQFFILHVIGLSLCAMAFFVPPSFFTREEKTQIVNILFGTSNFHTIKKLKNQGLVYYFFPYRWFMKWTAFKAGEYSLSSQQTAFDIFKVLSEEKVITYDLTFPEGINMFEISERLAKPPLELSKKKFLEASQDEDFIFSLLHEKLDSLEGYLYPNTYKVTRQISEKKIITMMVREFLTHYNRLDQSYDSHLKRHEIVILASVIEKETGVPWERPRIASVFFNRLKIGMRLQTDPTILYGILKETGVMPFNIRKKDIRRKTPYNTYTVERLPKGPIANPGREAMTAIFSPEKTEYLYFVSRNDGTHVFSENLADHQKAVNLYQKKQ